jgi:hypothetical protein
MAVSNLQHCEGKMVVNVNALPESELDYWAKLAIINQLIDEQKAINNFLTDEEGERLFDPQAPVYVEYDDSDEVVEPEQEIIEVENNSMVLEKSFKLRLIDKFNKIVGK